MKTKVLVLCGIPGSGKSTFVGECTDRQTADGRRVVSVSADKFFGAGKFDPSKLADAHASCIREFVEIVQEATRTPTFTWQQLTVPLIIVDNANTTVAEIAPYAAVALAYGCELEVRTLLCDVAVAHARNVHNVPLATVARMAANLAARNMPPRWPQSVVEMC